MIDKNILSQIIVGLVVTVIGAVIIDKMKTKPSDESSQNESPSRHVNRPSNSGDNQSGQQPPSNSTLPNSQSHSEARTDQPKEEDYRSYINPSQDRANVSVIILNANGSLSNAASSNIAEVYQKAGKSTSVGLIRNEFVRKPEFQELCEGNSEIIQKLNLGSYADYIAVGRINFAQRPGKLVDGTIVCSASISMSIISTSSKSLINSFAISNANGNGADESQAKADALQKLLDKYYNEHSSL